MRMMEQSYVRGSCLVLTSDQQAPNGEVFKQGSRVVLVAHKVPGKDLHQGMDVDLVHDASGEVEFQVICDQAIPCNAYDADDDDDDDDAEGERMPAGLFVLYLGFLTMMIAFFLALRRHWLRRAVMLEEQQRTWVVVTIPPTVEGVVPVTTPDTIDV